MKNIRLIFLILVIFLFLNGCAKESTRLNSNKTASYNNTTYANQTVQNKTNEIPSGCAYQNPPCDNKHICQNNTCVLIVGCQYNNPACDENSTCKNNTCIPKYACLNEECTGQNISYIIITRPIFIDSLKNFISFKNSQGFRIGVLTAEYINSSSSKVLLADKIKDMIQYFRKQGTKFFLLVGDAYTSIDYGPRTIPPIYHLDMNSLKDNWSLPTGYFYMDLQTVQYQMEGFNDVFFADPNNWDPINSGINHVIYSASSNWQDFAYVGRWPVRTSEEVKGIAQKTISVENNIEKNQYENQILILTVPQEPPYPVDCKKAYTSDSAGFFAKNTCENSISDLANTLGNSTQLYTIDQSGTQSQDFEQILFNSNNLAVQLSFHGNHDIISAGGKIYGNADSSRFQNIFPLLVPTGCSVGSFYWGASDSLDEAFLKASKGPAILAQPTYLLTFYDKLMEGKSVGEAYYAAETIDPGIINAWKQNQTSWFGSGNGLTLNGDDGLIGDPSLVIYPK